VALHGPFYLLPPDSGRAEFRSDRNLSLVRADALSSANISQASAVQVFKTAAGQTPAKWDRRTEITWILVARGGALQDLYPVRRRGSRVTTGADRVMGIIVLIPVVRGRGVSAVSFLTPPVASPSLNHIAQRNCLSHVWLLKL
jgi:hypothetical protein